VLNASCLAGVEQSPPEEAAGASTPRELLMTGPEHQNLIPTELIDDPLLTASMSHPIYKDINRAIIYAPGSSHTYIQ
jgi:hypothetical protein